jgi:guanylate kinase
MRVNSLVQGNLFILSAPSGAGKSSLISALLQQNSETNSAWPMQVSVSHTTRAPRPGEIDGVHYHFVSVVEFEQLIADQSFYEYAKVFDNYYGTSEAAIDAQLQQGIDVFLDIDWQGAQQVRVKKPSVTSIFISPPSKATLEQRLRQRGQDSDQVICARMQQAQAECSHYQEFDYIIVNDVFEHALHDFSTIVQNQRLTCARQMEKHRLLFNELLANK